MAELRNEIEEKNLFTTNRKIQEEIHAETQRRKGRREDFKQQLCALCDLRASARNTSIFHASARCFLEII